jgi:hypothetical protein
MQKECSIYLTFSGLAACCGPFFLFYLMNRWSHLVQSGYDDGWHDLIAVRLKVLLEEGLKYGIGHEPPM